MKLHNLQNISARNKKGKRKGIGEGSGNGKTAGRGQKGQKARSGGSVRIGFESGHIPLYRRLPMRGFNNANFRTDFAIVNLSDLDRVSATEIGPEELIAAGLVRSAAARIKVLGDGEISRAVTVCADRFSASAKTKIEAAGVKAVLRVEAALEETADGDPGQAGGEASASDAQTASEPAAESTDEKPAQ